MKPVLNNKLKITLKVITKINMKVTELLAKMLYNFYSN